MTIERHDRPYLFAKPNVTIMPPGQSEVIMDFGWEKQVLTVDSPDSVVIETFRPTKFSRKDPNPKLEKTQRLEKEQINNFGGSMASSHLNLSFMDTLKGRTVSFHWKPDSPSQNP